MANILFKIETLTGENFFTGSHDFVELKQSVSPGQSGSVSSYKTPVIRHPDNTGTVTFNNVFANTYWVTYSKVNQYGRVENTEFEILVPNDSGTYNVNDLIINTTAQPLLDTR